MLRAPEELLAERARTGVDVHDEVWEGVLHMAPPPSSGHQRAGGRLYRILSVRAEPFRLMGDHLLLTGDGGSAQV